MVCRLHAANLGVWFRAVLDCLPLVFLFYIHCLMVVVPLFPGRLQIVRVCHEEQTQSESTRHCLTPALLYRAVKWVSVADPVQIISYTLFLLSGAEHGAPARRQTELENH